MLTRGPRVFIALLALLGGPSLVSAGEGAPPPEKPRGQPAVKYEAEEGLPRDKAAEKRRDYAVLEAALNDLTSPKNPEYKYHIENVGPGREIVIDDKIKGLDKSALDYLKFEDQNIDHEDARNIPADIQRDIKRRNHGPARSLKDFKPANPDILVRNLNKVMREGDDPHEAFRKKFPTAWGYVWASWPGYSKDGNSAVVVFDGGPNGSHPLSWTYLLTKSGKRWVVEWRHCHPSE